MECEGPEVRHAEDHAARIAAARHVSAHTVCLRFNDGSEGEVGLGAELHGEVFEPWLDSMHFRSIVLHPELKTLV